MIITLITLWLLMGLAGYMFMRQGFLVDFEFLHGKEWAWDNGCTIVSLFGILVGPLFIALAFAT